MRHRKLAIGLFALISTFLLAGCASTPPLVLSEPIGPRPQAAMASEKRGALVVYSALDLFATGDPDRRYCEDYILYRPGDTRGQRVRNHLGILDEGPVPLLLPPGTYQLKARATGHGMVVVSAVIKVNRTTVIRLDGSAPEYSGASDAAQVCLPNGQIVGWKASR